MENIYFKTKNGASSIAVNSAILIKTKHGLVSIPVKDYSNDNVKNALVKYTGLDASKFICLSSSMIYGIYALKDKTKGFPIKKWSARSNTDYAYTFVVKYIKTL